MEITRDSAGGRHRLRVGERLVVRLDENPATGYIWNHSVSPPDALQGVDSRMEAGSPLPGAGGTRRLIFLATRPGTALVTLTKRRPWEPQTAVLDKLELTIDILE
jgi:predicted secreted protein